MKAKDKHKAKLIAYMGDWSNEFPNRTQMAKVLGIHIATLNFHFTPDEQNEILDAGLDLRKKQSASQRSEVYTAMHKEAVAGVVQAQKEFLDRTEGKVVERKELTGDLIVKVIKFGDESKDGNDTNS